MSIFLHQVCRYERIQLIYCEFTLARIFIDPWYQSFCQSSLSILHIFFNE